MSEDNGSPPLDLKHAFLVRSINTRYVPVKMDNGEVGASLVWEIEAMRPGSMSLKRSKLTLLFAPGSEEELHNLILVPDDE